MSTVAESNGRLFDPDSLADTYIGQRCLPDTEIARLYGPFDDRLRSRVDDLFDSARSRSLTVSERLCCTGLLLCVYRESSAYDLAQTLVAERQSEVLSDPHSRDLYHDAEVQSWHDIMFGMQYMGKLGRDVVDAYIEVELAGGKGSSRSHAARALNQACKIIRVIQPRRLRARGGLKPALVEGVVEETCAAMVSCFAETFGFSEEQVQDILSGTGYHVRGVGQLTLDFVSRS